MNLPFIPQIGSGMSTLRAARCDPKWHERLPLTTVVLIRAVSCFAATAAPVLVSIAFGLGCGWPWGVCGLAFTAFGWLLIAAYRGTRWERRNHISPRTSAQVRSFSEAS